MIKVLIADDHKVFREGIRAILDDDAQVEVVAEAGSGLEVLERLENGTIPDLILMDITMGETSGIDTTIQVLKKFPAIKVLVLSMHVEETYIVKMLEAGAAGYLLKEAGSNELLNAIRVVAKGDTYYSNQVSSVIIRHFTKGTNPKQKRGGIPLSKREVEVLQLIVEEYSNPEIAKKLFISIRTVDTHRRNLLEKTGSKNTAGLVKFAISKGIVQL